MNDKLTLKNSAILVSLVCNLNCRLCAAYSPYRKNNKFEEVEVLMSYVKKYFDVVDYVERFAISGGEPLLYKQLPELMSEFLKYSDQFGEMEIHTNGTILPSTELLDIIKAYGNKFLRFIIDNYGENLSVKVSEITARLDEYKIPYQNRDYYSENMHFNGWVDFGKLNNKIRSEEEAAELFSRCSYPKKIKNNMIIEGVVIPCNPIINRWLNGTADKNEYVNLTDETASVQELRRKLADMQKVEVYGTCEFCNGFFDDSPRFKPAEQLTSSELAEIRREIAQNSESESRAVAKA